MKKKIVYFIFSVFILIANKGLANDKKFHIDIVTPNGISLGGNIDATISSNGHWQIQTHVHNSGAIKYNYQLVVKIVTSNGIVYAFQHGGSAEGTENFDISHGPRRDDDWNNSGSAIIVQSNWNLINNGNLQWRMFYSDDIASVFSDLANSVAGDGKLLITLAGDVVTQTVNGVAHVFNQTVDGIGNLAKCAVQDIKGIADATGFFINQAGQYIYFAGGGFFNLVLHGDFPQTRSIHQDEYNWANAMVFNNTLPPIDKIKLFNFTSNDDHRFYTWPGIGDYIYMNIGDAFNNPMTYLDASRCYPAPGQVFIHELTHAWQIWHYTPIGMTQRYLNEGGSSMANYQLNCPPNTINTNYKIEQEATMVDRNYLKIYYNPDNKTNCAYCDFQQTWVENHIRNAPFNVGTIITMQMRNYVAMNNLAGVIGSVSNAPVQHSAGNGKDGDGYFMAGSIPWSVIYYTNNKVYANWGDIRKKYNSTNAERGILGWPVNTMATGLRNNGACEYFQHGAIYTTPTGTFEIDELILAPWVKQNYEKGALGYPVADLANGIQRFEHGYIQEVPVSVNNQLTWTTNVHVYTKEEELLNSNHPKATINPQPLPPILRQ